MKKINLLKDKKSFFVIGTIFLLIGVAIAPSISGSSISLKKSKEINEEQNLNKNLIANKNGEYYAILAACAEYEDSSSNLPIAEWKLKSLYRSLKSASNWKEENIILLVNDHTNKKSKYSGGATKANIEKALDEMADKVGPDDVFLFSWQGHGSEVPDEIIGGDEGIFDRFDEVICPYDCYREPGLFGKLKNYITDDYLGKAFSKINSKGQCLIFESCLSGGLVSGGIFSFDTDGDGYINSEEAKFYNNDTSAELEPPEIDDVDGRGRVVIVSTLDGTLGRATWISGFPMTVSIAHGLKRGLTGYAKDRDNDGWVSAEEVFKWARPRVFAQNSIFWFGIWTYCFIVEYELQKAEGVSDPVQAAIEALKFVFVEFCILQIQTFIMTGGRFLLNWPNMVDRYKTVFIDLPIVKIDKFTEAEEVNIPYLPAEIWNDEDALWGEIDQSYWPELEVESSFLTNNNNLDVSFSGNAFNAPPPYTYKWDFGDRTESVEQNPTHTYSDKSKYSVSLTVIDSAWRAKKIYMDVSPGEKVRFRNFVLLPIFDKIPNFREFFQLFF